MKLKIISRPPRCRLLSVLILLILAGCLQKAPTPPDQSSFASIERRSARLFGEAHVNSGGPASAVRQVVIIEGNDILLPEVAPDQIETTQSYYFDIAAEDPDGRSMRELLASDALRIETIGADATLIYPVASPKTMPGSGSPAHEPAINTGKARLKVTTSKEGALRPFTIRAWYPSKVNAPDAEAWSATRAVKVFYGDIRTRVQIVSRTEAEGLFGSSFAEHFYVGRVFLRNRSTTKSLAVYTTSMRVPVIFYRKTELPGGLTPASAERLEHLAQARSNPNSSGVVLIRDAENLVAEFLQLESGGAVKIDPFVRPPEDPNQPRRWPYVTRDEFDSLVTRVLAEWARLAAETRADLRNSEKLTKAEQSHLIDAALVGPLPPRDAREPGKTRDDQASAKARAVLRSRPTDVAASNGRDLILRVWSLREDLLIDAERRAKIARLNISALQDEILPLERQARTKLQESQARRYKQITRELNEIADLAFSSAARNLEDRRTLVPEEPKAALIKNINGVTEASHREAFRHAATSLPAEVNRYALALAVTAYLESLDGASDHPLPPKNPAVGGEIANLRERALWQGNAGASEKNPARRTVNLGGQTLALSPDSHLQRQLVEGGYVWRDAYRPMTFQTVLSSVMFTHSKDPKTMTVKVFEALATVAGGAIGLSGSPASSTLRATNFFSSVFVPTLRATLVEDLNKHITNLGEMAMDTVIIIPPNDSVDRYVFFPRGAIYNFPDEFDSVTPGYIRGIESDELFVEAIPVNSDQVVHGGSVDANTLVTRALNEGERSESARLLGVAQTQAKLRTVELANLLGRIDSVMAEAQRDTTNPPDAASLAKIQRGRNEAQKMVAAFVSYFGPDQSGALSTAQTRHGLSLQDMPPVALPGDLLKLPVGTTSVPWPLNVTDADTPMKALSFAKKADASVDAWLESVSFDTTDTQRAKAVFKIKNVARSETERKELALTVADVAGSVAGFNQPIQLMPLAMDAPVFAADDEGAVTLKPVANDKKSYTAPLGMKRGTITLSIQLYDADPALLKLATPVTADGGNGYVESTKLTTDRSTGKMTLSIQLDASNATDPKEAPKLDVFLVPASTAADAAALGSAKLTQLSVTLDLSK